MFMSNKHIKIINGRKYYYQSIRKGDKVTSKYLGPVEERTRKQKAKTAMTKEKPVEMIEAAIERKEETREEDLETPDDGYIG